MKRALLIAGGTVGGLGVVLSMTPPHLGVAANNVNALASSTTTPRSTPDAPQSVSPGATPVSSPTATPVISGVSGSFTGARFDANESGRVWGAVTVTVTLRNGEIANVIAMQSPSSRGNNAFNYLTPAVLTQKLSVKTVMAMTPTSLVSQIRGYTGASYSAFAYWQSLQSALSKTGL